MLEHTKEVARIAEYMAGEMGSDARLARRAGLFHDIGKAIDREVEGTHIEIGMQLMQALRREGRSHPRHELPPRGLRAPTVEAMLITAADALSAARPGARREMLETYVKRLEAAGGHRQQLQGRPEELRHAGGPGDPDPGGRRSVNDDQAYWIAKDVSRRIESEMQYPGQIKVTVMRELRAVEIAR